MFSQRFLFLGLLRLVCCVVGSAFVMSSCFFQQKEGKVEFRLLFSVSTDTFILLVPPLGCMSSVAHAWLTTLALLEASQLLVSPRLRNDETTVSTPTQLEEIAIFKNCFLQSQEEETLFLSIPTTTWLLSIPLLSGEKAFRWEEAVSFLRSTSASLDLISYNAALSLSTGAWRCWFLSDGLGGGVSLFWGSLGDVLSSLSILLHWFW